MARLGLGLGLNLVPKILGGYPIPAVSGYDGYYLAQEEFLTIVPTNSVSNWEDLTVKTYDVEEVTNGDFSLGTDNWLATGDSIFSVTDGVASIDGNGVGTFPAIQNDFSTTSYNTGDKFLIECTIIRNDTVNGVQLRTTLENDQTKFTGTGRVQNVVTATSSGVVATRVGAYNDPNGSIEVTDVSLRKILTGYNDLVQSTSADQPTWSSADDAVNLADDQHMTGLKTFTGSYSFCFMGLNVKAFASYLLSNSANANHWLYIKGNGVLAIRNTGGFITDIISFTPYLNQTLDLVVVKSGTTLRTYIDGSLVSTDTASGSYVFDTFGEDMNGNDTDLSGSLITYDRDLTATEVGDLSA